MSVPRYTYSPKASSSPNVPKLEKGNNQANKPPSPYDDDSSETTATTMYIPPEMHRFANGAQVPRAYALSNTYCGDFYLWPEDDKHIKVPGYQHKVRLVGFGCKDYMYVDFVMDIERVMKYKYQICGTHQLPASKLIKKADVAKAKPSLVLQDSFGPFKRDAILNKIVIGSVIDHDTECGDYRPLCKMDKLRVVKDKVKKEESKVDAASKTANPFMTSRRSMAIGRVGLPDFEMNWYLQNQQQFNMILRRIFNKYPIFRGARKTAAKWAKEMVMDPSKDMAKVPPHIAKAMQAELKGSGKPTKDQLLTGCGLIADTNPSVHGSAIDALKEQLKQMQQQLQLLSKQGNNKMNEE